MDQVIYLVGTDENDYVFVTNFFGAKILLEDLTLKYINSIKTEWISIREEWNEEKTKVNIYSKSLGKMFNSRETLIKTNQCVEIKKHETPTSPQLPPRKSTEKLFPERTIEIPIQRNDLTPEIISNVINNKELCINEYGSPFGYIDEDKTSTLCGWCGISHVVGNYCSHKSTIEDDYIPNENIPIVDNEFDQNYTSSSKGDLYYKIEHTLLFEKRKEDMNDKSETYTTSIPRGFQTYQWT